MIRGLGATISIVLYILILTMDAPDLAAAEVHALQPRNASLSRHEGALSQSSKDFAAGAFGGMLGVIAGQPLDTLRIRMQQAHCTHSNVVGMWRSMSKAEGVRGLFKGMSYPLYTTALQNAVTFQAQRAALRWLSTSSSTNNSTSSNTTQPGSSGSSSNTVSNAAVTDSGSSSSSSGDGGSSDNTWRHTGMAGMFAGGVQTLISCPVELLKIRLQLQQAMPGTPGYVGPWTMAGQVVAGEGVIGLFRGFWLTFLRDVPSYGLYFITYDWAVQASCNLLNRARASLATHQERHSGSPALSSSSSTGSSSGGLMLAMPAAMAGGAGTTAGWAAAAAAAAGPRLHHATSTAEDGSGWYTGSSSSSMQRQLGRKEGAFTAYVDVSSNSDSSSSARYAQGPDSDSGGGGGGSSSGLKEEGWGGWAPLGPDSALVQLLAGGFAGALAWFSIYPLDILKSRVQAADTLRHAAAASATASPFSSRVNPPHPLSTPLLHPCGTCPPALCPPPPPLAHGGAWAHAVEAVNKEGWRVFTKGLGPTLGRAFLVNAVIFAGFEAAMRGLDPL